MINNHKIIELAHRFHNTKLSPYELIDLHRIVFPKNWEKDGGNAQDLIYSLPRDIRSGWMYSPFDIDLVFTYYNEYNFVHFRIMVLGERFNVYYTPKDNSGELTIENHVEDIIYGTLTHYFRQVAADPREKLMALETLPPDEVISKYLIGTRLLSLILTTATYNYRRRIDKKTTG